MSCNTQAQDTSGVIDRSSALVVSSDAADQAMDKRNLAAALERMDGLAADFEQQIRDSRGQVMEQSTGQVRLKKPDFRWDVNEPFPQTIVTDGDQLKIYDPDLEQLTIRSLSEALEDTPLALLTNEKVVLGDSFAVFDLGDGVFELVPTSPDALFANIRLSFDAQRLTNLTIRDHLDQVTEIQFLRFKDRSVIRSSDFKLEVPPETDVIGG
ncbi:MAG: outer membrane lipoprotein chaperone LolA [Proteobacteria bacterium]|nr:outer membrane lipoprotein chaperone LolA [Pseudomonadota bacterium]